MVSCTCVAASKINAVAGTPGTAGAATTVKHIQTLRNDATSPHINLLTLLALQRLV